MINFVVPIRHPDTVKDKAHQLKCLRELFASFDNIASDNWKAIVVANAGQILPALPRNVIVKQIDLVPEKLDYTGLSLEEMWRLIRADKGGRIQAGMAMVDETDQAMVVDDDDLLHRDLVDFVANNGPSDFWFVQRGYFWEDGTRRVGHMNRLYKHCGSSLIVPKTAYMAFGEPGADPELARDELGSHHLIFKRHPEDNGAWRPIPFRATIYRTRHKNASMTASSDESRQKMFNADGFRRFRALFKSLMQGFRGNARLGTGAYPLTSAIRTAFFGKGAADYQNRYGPDFTVKGASNG